MQPLPNEEEEQEDKLLRRAKTQLEAYLGELRPDPNVEWSDESYEVADTIYDLAKFIGEKD